MQHELEASTAEQEYFGRLNKNGKAAYRRAVTTLTGSLPTWAVGPRTKVTTLATTSKVTTSAPSEAQRPEAYTDPLAAISVDDLREALGLKTEVTTSEPSKTITPASDKVTTLPDVDPLTLT